MLAHDVNRSLDELLAELTLAEREQVERRGLAERRLRHFALGRVAARVAVRRALDGKTAALSIDILSGPGGEPQVQIDGQAGIASVSVSHSGRLVAACGWRDPGENRCSAGVDLERLRQTEIAHSGYVFTQREQRLLARAPQGPMLAGLAAWTVKEAVWKALRWNSSTSPVDVEIRAMNLAQGRAAVQVGNGACPGHTGLQVRSGLVDGPDGWYVLSVASLRMMEW